MKKQLIAITLAAVMAAGMTGCGSSNNGSDTANNDVSLDYKTDDMLGTIRNPFVISFNVATGIHEVEAESNEAEAWYDLNGRCLKHRPVMEGVYIRRYMDKETRKVKAEKVIIKNNK